MERPDFSKVTKILTSGTWFDIKPGSLQGASGVQHVNVGAVEPLYRFRFPDGQEGAILARCLDRWAPLVTGDLAARPEPMQEFDEPLRIRNSADPMASDPLARCDVCGGTHVPALSDVSAIARADRLPILCLCECCAATVRVAARLIDEIALEQAEIVRARIVGIADRLRDSGVVLRSVDIPQSERAEVLGCVQAN